MSKIPHHEIPPSPEEEIRALQSKVSSLEKEIADQRRENARLKQKISRLKGAYGETPELSLREMRQRKKKDPASRERQDLFRTGAVNARRFSRRNYFLFLIHSVKESTLGLIARRISRFFLRWRMFRNVAMIAGAILLTILLSAFFLTALPFLLLFLLLSLLAVILGARAANRRMKNAFESVSRIRVIFFSEQINFKENSFAKNSAISMAEEKNTVIIAVTPRLWSTAGLGGKGMFFTVRQEKPGLFLVRRSYYFILKRKVIHASSADVTMMYG